MPNTEQAKTLQANLANLKGRDLEFASSMLTQLGAKGTLSDKQWYWVDQLAQRAVTPAAAPVPAANVGEFQGVVALFLKAKTHLKYPKIRLQVEGREIVLSLAGPNSKAPGTINVVTPEGAERHWLGRVAKDGGWTKSPRALAQTLDGSLARVLMQLATAPAATAAEYGKLTGNCCFCGRPLEDERSTAVGYGPVCAMHWELPWGTERHAF